MAELRFHWGSSLDSGQKKSTQKYRSDLLDLDGAIEFAQDADALGVESLLMAQSYTLPDPLPIIGALARETERVKYILAYRPGLLSPTLFTQIVNTVSWISDGRIALNIVAGTSPVEQGYYGDFLAHDERYAREGEFLDILHRLWGDGGPVSFTGDHYKVVDAQLGLGHKGGGRPEIYISGNSAVAQQTAIRYGDCWFRYGDTPEEIAKAAAPLVAAGTDVGLRLQVLARGTREEALTELAEIMSETDENHRAYVKAFVEAGDSEAVKNSMRLAEEAGHGWLSPVLYSGAVAYRGGPALCLVGSYEEVAAYLMEYKAAGVGQFIFSGWPARDEMRTFFRNVLPVVRAYEKEHDGSLAGAR